MVRRSAFTLIELIFAIIIIAIVVVSMPLMMKTNENAIEANIAQEALFASSAKMMQVLSFPWDVNATDSTNPNSYGKVVDVTGGITTNAYKRSDANGTLNPLSSYRVGHILQDNHRRFHDYQSTTSKLASSLTSSANPTALNNAKQASVSLEGSGITAMQGKGYKNAYKMDVDVIFVDDNMTNSIFNFNQNPASGVTNMKLITVTIRKENNDPVTVLRSYSANIGEFDFAKRRF